MPTASEVATKTSPTTRTTSTNDVRHKSPEVDRRALSPKPPSRLPESPKRAATPPPPAKPKEVKEEKEPEVPPADSDDTDIINDETFQQILELDDEDDSSFSWGMVVAFFSQASGTFDEMNAAYAAKDLKKLSSLGHFLKGSSAALGVQKVQDSCERIQHYGKLRDEEENTNLTSDVALKKIGALLPIVKTDFEKARVYLRNFYKDKGVDVDE